MLLNMFMLISMILISSLLMIINWLIAMNISQNREKNSPFECGFNPQSNSRLPFSIHYYLITLMFLIFDIEIILMIPSILMIKFNSIHLSIILMIFFILMIISLIFEWIMSFLKWIM